jgi:hypothetical protein
MAKKYTSLRIDEETYKKIIRARGKLETKTGERHSLEKTVNVALDVLLHK